MNDNYSNLDAQTLLTLGRNLKIVSELRERRINGMTPENWMTLWETRVGYEPMFRLCFALVRAMDDARVSLMEIMAEDPCFMVECLRNGNMLPYCLLYSGNNSGNNSEPECFGSQNGQ
jgi:hypothetical protein